MHSQVVKLSLIATLTTGMLFYTFQSIAKFREHKISRALYRDTSEKTLMFPSITMCSGFRHGNFTPEKIARWAHEAGEQDPELLNKEAFDRLTYGKRDFLTYFTQARDDYWLDNFLEDDSLWEEQYHEYYGGRCATFNPVNRTRPGETNSVAIGFGLPERSYYDGCDYFGAHRCHFQYATFLHARDAFVYNKGHKFVGQSFMYPELGKSLQMMLTKKRVKKLNQEHEPCEESGGIKEWKECVREAYDERAGCKMPWTTEDIQEKCNMSMVHQRFSSLERHLWWDIDNVVSDDTGCILPCEYDLYELKRVDFGYNYVGHDLYPKETSFVIQIFYVETVTEVSEEFEAFDKFSLLGEVGGALGLFLGWSCLQLILDLVGFLQSHFRTGKTKK